MAVTFTVEKDSKQVPVRGLLADFITEKAQSYVEPAREGTPRGQPIGFSRKKYLASLLCITAKNLKEIARTLGVSYGLLRKWRTEPEFRGLAEQHRKEFAELFWNHLWERYKTDKETVGKFLKLPLKKFANSEPQFLPYDEFKDAALYSWELKLSIFEANRGAKTPKLLNDDELIVQVEFHRIMDILFRAKGREPLWQKNLEKRRSEMQQNALAKLKDILSKPKLSTVEKKRALNFVRLLELNLSMEAERV